MARKTFVEFFAGIGLVRKGLEQAGWHVEFATDIAEKKFEMYRDNFDDGPEKYILADIHHLRGFDIPSVTLATASFPCTDLSLAGYRRGLAGEQSGTFWEFTRLLKELDGRRPPLLLIENVTGFATCHGGKDFADAIRALNKLGYACDAFILDAVNFLPQSRPRLFVVGIYDAPTTRDADLQLRQRDKRLLWPQLTSFVAAHRSFNWHVLDLPAPPEKKRTLASIIENVPDDSSRWWSPERVRYLLGQMSPRHKRIANVLRRQDKASYATVYRRVRSGRSMAEVRADGIAGCLRTPRGGSSRQILLEVSKSRVRARFMTPYEYARLMGADDYRIRVPDNQAYFGFGDAVCVPVMSWIAVNVLDHLLPETTRLGAVALAKA